ncbi:tigger transposable element-derived protein 1-like [Pelobates fuscus]|uniref:tigger transposable element-derived protein 1-like n=1 Tax=Pelobates fuscus TaxID=191477 RepID=UPI002FE4A9F2
MPPKRKEVTVGACNENIKRRKAITLETKLNIITDHDAGNTTKEVATKYSLSKSTVSTILKDREKYLKEVKNAQSLHSTWIRTKENKSLIPHMEKLLTAWISDQTGRLHMPVTYATICAKALSLFEMLKQRKGGNVEETFSASSGWFDRYKKRAGWHNIKILGESASADTEAAKLFPAKLAEILEEGNYSPSQVFNADETGLFWKRMPSRSYIAKEESSMPGFKPAKDRLTLFLGGNAAGDCKLKPMMVHRAENPRTLKGIVKSTLPVIWKANKKGWVTASLFEDWFSHYFVPEVKKYCEDKSIPFQVILLVDNAPGHPPSLQHHHPNVKIIFLPPNTASILQPMDQGVIATFKALYLRQTFEMLIKATDNETGPSLKDFWRKSFNILDAIKITAYAWNKISETTMKGVWKKLCPQLFGTNVERFEEPAEIVQQNTKAIVTLANRLDLDISVTDINDLLEAHKEELTNEDLLDMEEQEEVEEVEDVTAPETPVHSFTLKGLEEAFQHMEKAINIFESQDSNFERSTKVARDLRNAYNCYKEIYNEKRRMSWKQTTIRACLQKAAVTSSVSNEPETSEVQPSTSTKQLREDCAVPHSSATCLFIEDDDD